MASDNRVTYVLVDGENIDATLGTSILGRRPRPEERPRWERVLRHVQERWGQPTQGLFFLAANNELPMSFVQALLAIGFRPVPLTGKPGEKVVDIAIQRTLQALREREDDVVLVSNEPKAYGVLTAVSPGTATITAVDGSSGIASSNQITVTVVP